ncbi:MAG: cysteine desulfurase NifS [Deltaproteobacteria bacterium]|nr:cysteine desulfurase NifS [Deltaproteobacteria bacterium]
MKRIYLDYAATTPVDVRVVKAMLPHFTEIYGNPSSLHAFGQEAKHVVEESRHTVASFIGAKPEEIIFTSGGTESNNFTIGGIAHARSDKGNHIITSRIEHHAILEPCHFLEKEGFQVTYLPVDKYGLVDPGDVRKAINAKTILISIMHANNEIGTIQPIAEIGSIARENGVYFHTDAVQTFGHLPVDVDELNLDLLSASGHKLYGPKGVGIIYARKGIRMSPFMQGGGQEKGRRASTHNVPGIVGLGKAVDLAKEEMGQEIEHLTVLRDRLIQGILNAIEYSSLNGHPTKRLPNNVNVSIAYVEGESMLLNLDMEGIACSTGSACSSASLEPSHVLTAIGLPHELAHGSLRFSLGRPTTSDDINYVLSVLPGIVGKLRAMSPLYKKEVKYGSVQ